MKRLLPRLLLALAFVAITHPTLRAETRLDAIVKLIPPDALAVVASPNLRAASDDLAQSIEAMDRGHLLLGSKPLDQLKAILGFSVGVNDLGGAAVVLMPPAPDDDEAENGQAPNVLAIVAVTDAGAFLNGNFTSVHHSRWEVRPAACVHARWGLIYATVLDKHVMLSPRRELLTRVVEPNEPAFTTKLGAEGRAVAQRGNIFAYIRRDLRDVLNIIPPELAALGIELPHMRSLDRTVISIDFDPLGFFVRAHTSLQAESDPSRAIAALAAKERQAELMRLPNRPYIFAGGFDLTRITPEAAAALREFKPLDRIIGALAPADSAQLAIYPSPVGRQAGLLNEAALMVRGRSGAFAAEALRRLVEAGDRTNVTWRKDVAVGDAGRADLYEARLTESDIYSTWTINFLFGPAGMRGYLGRAGESAFITFSQRTPTFAIARQAAAESGPRLADNDVIRSMQSWMPAQRDVEFYIDLGELQAYTTASQSPGPQSVGEAASFSIGEPPIGGALRLDETGVEKVLIVPAAVLAPILDAQVESIKARGLTPRPHPRPRKVPTP